MPIESEVLERIALSRLPELQVASGLFRATARVEGVEDEGPPATTLRAGAVVLLGLLRADQREVSQPFSTGALRTRVLGDLGGETTSVGDLGLSLWAESRSQGGAVSEIHALLKRKLGPDKTDIPLQDLSWAVSGLTEASVRFGDEAGIASMLDELAEELIGRAITGTGLISDVHRRRRGAAVSIESQLHALNALGQMKRADLSASDDQPLQRLADVLLAIQGEDGSWPGLIDPVRGQPTAFYPVLTVSQIATAPISMRICQEVGLEGDFSAAIENGVAWARGGNPLGFDLVHEMEARIDRGILPRQEPGAVQRGISTATRRIRGRLEPPGPSRLILDPSVSSEDLGWVLEAWAGR